MSMNYERQAAIYNEGSLIEEAVFVQLKEDTNYNILSKLLLKMFKRYR